MTTIKLLDARRGLNLKCRELFADEKIAEAIYRYLCDGIEECEDAQPVRMKGRWVEREEDMDGMTLKIQRCSECGGSKPMRIFSIENYEFNFCPNCGARMSEGDE